MNKEEFLKKLRKRLEVLEDSEIEDILSEYEGFIDEKVSKGLTEEQAVKELGNFNEIVDDLLAAYKVKRTSGEENIFNKVINKISDAIDLFMESLNNKSGKDIVKVLIEIILILFLICLLKIPFAMIRDLGSSIFFELTFPIGNIFSGIWAFIIEISYIIVAVIFFIKTFEKRYFKDITENIVNKREEKPDSSKSAKIKKEKATKTEVKKENKTVVEPTNHSFFYYMNEICIYILKFLVLIFLIGIICYLIGISVALGFMIYLIVNGVHYFGILLLIIALFLGGTLFLELCINFLFNKHNKAVLVVSKIISIIIFTGIGLTMSAVEIAETEIIYDRDNLEIKEITKEIPMTDDILIYNYDQVIIDNNLNDKIKIVYKYPDYYNNLDLSIELFHYNKAYYLGTNIHYFRWNKKILNNFINNLKDKKIYANDYHVEKIIYISEKNYEQIEKNHNKEYDHYIDSSFTKTYTITSIVPSKDDETKYITIYPYNREDLITTVKLNHKDAEHLTLGTYEFTFKHNGPIFEDTPENIFENCHIESITPTNKVGTE
ncbi:MAG: DUF1700 domain-containing protein [Bacilli bacterium]|jgi:uncharacterized membrane protein|nr:DUF1700 domain-containing protein [Bacilli bacterium]